MLSRLKSLFIDFICRYLFIVLIILGVTCICIEFFAYPQTERPISKQLFHIAGTTALISGAFASLLKSYQFIGIFKEELADVVTHPEEYLPKSKLQSTWKKIAHKLYCNKFPAINDELQSKIEEYYFPTSHNHYKSDHTIDLTVTYDESSNFITVDEITRMTLYPDNNTESFTFRSTSTIPLLSENDNQTNYTIIEFTLDKSNITSTLKSNLNKKRNDKKLKSTWEVTLPRSDTRHDICYHLKKIMSLETNPSFGFTTNTFINGLTVIIRYPEQLLDIDFFPVGTLSSFGGLHSQKGMLTKYYKGLIFPKQGFRIFYRRKVS